MYNLPADPPAAPEAAAKASDVEVAAASAAESALTNGSPTADAVADAVEALDIGLKDGGGENATSPVAVDDAEGEKRVLTREEEIEEALACPCLDAMRDGSCGDVFISAYRCFLESETEPQGMECVDAFGAMQGCMAQHPEEYGLDDETPEGGDGGDGGVDVEVSAADAVSSADDVLSAVSAAERDDARAASVAVEAVDVADATVGGDGGDGVDGGDGGDEKVREDPGKESNQDPAQNAPEPASA